MPRTDGSPSPQPTAPTITVNYSAPIFQAQFKYDTATNSYDRSLAGQPHVDAATDKQDQQQTINSWLKKYHSYRPHQALGYLTSDEYKAKLEAEVSSMYRTSTLTCTSA